MREPANESLFTDVSRLRSYRCTIIVPTTSRAFVEREGCCASELDKGHKRVGKGAQSVLSPHGQNGARAVPTRFVHVRRIRISPERICRYRSPSRREPC